MADVFISYAREDRGAVEKLAAQIEAAGLSCWWDKQLVAGARYRERTEIELNAAKAVLVVWTRNSVSSHWVADEAAAAQEAGKLAPISLDGVSPPLGFRQFQVIDFTGWKGDADGSVQDLVAALAAFTPQAEIRNAPRKRGSSSSAFQPMRWLPVPAPLAVVSAAAALLFVGGLATWWINFNSNQATASPVSTLAVLPFDALDDDPAVVRMASVLPRDMADLFSRGGISITASARSMTYTGDAKARAASELGADLLLDGAVRREGDQAHVSIRLFHAGRGVTLWSTEMKADPDDAFIDDRLSALAARMIYWPAPLDILNSDRPNAVEEARAFLRILQTSNDGDQIGAMEASVKFALDAPDLVAARTSVAIQTMVALPALPPENRAEALALARREAEASLRLGPHEGSAYLAALFVVAPGNWAERISIAREGMEIDPQYTRLENNLAGLLLAVGATKDAVSGAKRARAEEPLSPVRPPFLARMLLASGDIGEMDSVLDAHEQVWPNDASAAGMRLRVAQWRADPDEADVLLTRQAPPGSAAAASLGIAVERALIDARRSGREADMEEVARLCSSVADEVLKHPPASACLFAGGVLGRPNISIAAAEFLLPRIHNSPDGEDAWLLLSEPDGDSHANELFMPWMVPVRADPRIIDVFERMGLLDYWKSTGKWPDFCETEIAAQRVCSEMKAGK
jgi:TolB-like protein